MKKRKGLSLLLACAIVLNLSLSAVAEPIGQESPAVGTEQPTDSTGEIPEGSGEQDSGKADESLPSDGQNPAGDTGTNGTGEGDVPTEGEPETPEQPVEDPAAPPAAEETKPDSSKPEGDQQETPEQNEGEPAPQDSFRIDAVTVQTTPQPLTSEGGSVVFTVSGQFLNQEHIWLKLEKSGSPYRIVPVKNTTGFLDTVKKTLLPSSNITAMKSEPITLDAATAESMFIYTVSVCHTEDESVPELTSNAWVDSGIEPIIVPKAGGEEPELPEEDLTIGESFPNEPTAPDQEQPEEELPAPGGDQTEPEEPGQLPEIPDNNELVPGVSDDHTEEPGQDGSQTPDQPITPPTPPDNIVESKAEITGVDVSTMPSPITADGGYIVAGVSGRNLSGGSVWVKVTSNFPDFEAGVWEAKVNGDSRAYTDKILLPRNQSSLEDVVYHISVLHRGAGSTAPGLNAEDWQAFTSADVIVPKREPTEVPPIDEDKLGQPRVDSVQTVTTPETLTSAGGVACVTVTGVDLNRGDLWVMLDSGDNNPIIKKIKDASSTLAVSQPINIPANEQTGKSVSYKVYFQVRNGGTPMASDGGWKKYSGATVTVPRLSKSEQPTISNVAWTPDVSGNEIRTRFYVTGTHLGEGENSVWIKVAPDGSDIDAKIFPADQSMSATSAETAQVTLKQKTRANSDEPVEYEVYAMAKTNKKKPSAREDGWKKFTSRSLTEQPSVSTKPRVTAALVSPTGLPGEGGVVTATIVGENLDDQSVYVVGTPRDGGEPITKEAVLDPKSGDLKANFALTPDGQADTETYSFQYQMGRSNSWTYMGSASMYGVMAANGEGGGSVAPPVATASLTFKILDAKGSEVSKINNVPTGAKVEITSTNEIAAGTEYFIRFVTSPANPDDPGTKIEFTDKVGLVPVPSTPGEYSIEYLETTTADSSGTWTSANLTFKILAPTTVSEIKVEPAELSSSGGTVKVSVKGDNLEKVWIQLKKQDALGTDSSVKSATKDSEVFSHNFDIEANINTEKDIVYDVYVKTSNDSTSTDSVIAEENKTDKTVTVKAAPKITGATIEPKTLWHGGGEVNVTLTGNNFTVPSDGKTGTIIYAQLRPVTGSSGTPTSAVKAEIKDASSTKAVTFTLPENSTNGAADESGKKAEEYQLYAEIKTSAITDPDSATLTGEVSNAKVTVNPFDATKQYAVSSVEYYLDQEGKKKVDYLTAKGGYAKVILTGSFDAAKKYYVYISGAEGTNKIQEATISAISTFGTEITNSKAVTGLFKIPANSSGASLVIKTLDVSSTASSPGENDFTGSNANTSSIQVAVAPQPTITSVTAQKSANSNEVTVTINGSDFDTNTGNEQYFVWVKGVTVNDSTEDYLTNSLAKAKIDSASAATYKFTLPENVSGNKITYKFMAAVVDSGTTVQAGDQSIWTASLKSNTVELSSVEPQITGWTLPSDKIPPVDPDNPTSRSVTIDVAGTNLGLIKNRSRNLYVRFVSSDSSPVVANTQKIVSSFTAADDGTTGSGSIIIDWPNPNHTDKTFYLEYAISTIEPTTWTTVGGKAITVEGLPTTTIANATFNKNEIDAVGDARSVTVTPTFANPGNLGSEKMFIRFVNESGVIASEVKEVTDNTATNVNITETTEKKDFENLTLQYQVAANQNLLVDGKWAKVINGSTDVTIKLKGKAVISGFEITGTTISGTDADPFPSDVGSLALTIKGYNFKTTPTPYLYVRLKNIDSSTNPVVEKTALVSSDAIISDGTQGTTTLEIPVNGTTSRKSYQIEYKVYYSQQEEVELKEVNTLTDGWGNGKIIKVGAPGAAKIDKVTTSVPFFKYSGGSVDVTVTGSGLTNVSVWMRPSSALGENNLLQSTTSQDGTTATLTFNLKGNPGNSTIYYDICAVAVSVDDANTGGWGTPWASFPVYPETDKRVVNCGYVMSEGGTMTSSGGDVNVNILGSNLQSSDAAQVWVRVVSADSEEFEKIVTARVLDGTKAQTAEINIPANTSDTAAKVYDVQVILSKTDPTALNFSSPLCTTQIIVPSTTEGQAKITEVTKGTISNGKIPISLKGEKLSSVDIYLYLEAPGMDVIKATGISDTEASAELVLPAGLSWIKATYPIHVKLVGQGEAIPEYPGEGWTKRSEVEISSASTSGYTGPVVDSYVTSPESVEYAEPFNFVLAGKNLNNSRVWIFKSTKHLTNDAVKPAGEWYTITQESGDFTAAQIAIANPSEGLNCFYILKTDDAISPSSQNAPLQDAVHIGDYTLKPKRDDTIYVTGMSESVIEAGKETQVRVDFSKNFFPEDETARALYKARAVKTGDTGTVVTDEVALTNWNVENTKAEATLTFPTSTVKGETYQIQITEDGTTWKLVALSTNHADIATISTKGGSSGGDDNNNNNNNNNGNPRPDSVTYVAKEELAAAIQKAKDENASQITIYVDRNLRVSRDFFERAEYCEKDIVLDGGNYKWTVPAGSRVSSSIERYYDLGIAYSSAYETKMREMVGDFDYFQPFSMKYDGPLPTRMVLTLYTYDNFKRGADLYVYRYNPDKDDATKVAEPVVSSTGLVNFNMTHCSDYFMTNRRIDESFLSAEEERPADWYEDGSEEYPYVDEETPGGGGSTGGKVNPNTGL